MKRIMTILGLIIGTIIILMGTAACTKAAPTTIINNTTVMPSSTVTVSDNNSDLVNAANSEVASVMTANQAYAAMNDGKFATNSNELQEYLSRLPDAIYFFNAETGIITSVVNGNGITKNLQWDSIGQQWK